MVTQTPRILVLGSGIAGTSIALEFAQFFDVTLVAKDVLAEGATRYAQGGIASVWSKSDRFQDHKNDTLNAGVGLCDETIVDLCVREGPGRVRELIELGVPFTRANRGDPAEEFDLHKEGGHGHRRILHADDLTGLAIQNTLIEKVRSNPRIEVLEHHIAIDLVTEGKVFKRWRKPGRCLGAYLLDVRSGEVKTLAADLTVLATGGAGRVYLYTSNPDTATGDGVAMAYRAGARVANMEFMQFHPTCLYHPAAKNFLITEALRGEGAILKNLSGKEFMDRHDPKGSLAPRDIVARAIDIEMKRTGDRYVHLDATRISAEKLKTRFPNIYERCLGFGIDITQEPIPVVPAAHYTCGGVVADADGATSIERLFAIGEVACTGLHGANRLASNSLLEAVVFSHRAFKKALPILEAPQDRSESSIPIPEWETGFAVRIEERMDIATMWSEVRSLMWNYVGIVRSDRRLDRAKRRLEFLKEEINQYYWDYLVTKDLIELRNILTVAELIVQCAALRKESRGLHYTVDYPERNDQFYKRDTVL